MTDPLAIIRTELAWPLRYPPVPEITPDTMLGDWFGPIDRICVQMALDEAFGFEISDAEAAAWQSVGDMIATVERLAGKVVA